MKDKLSFPLAGILCATLLILPAVLLGYNLGKDAVSYAEPPGTVETEETGNRAGEAVDTPDPLETEAGEMGAITIPGFEQVRLSASPAPQTALFYNPEGKRQDKRQCLELSGGQGSRILHKMKNLKRRPIPTKSTYLRCMIQ